MNIPPSLLGRTLVTLTLFASSACGPRLVSQIPQGGSTPQTLAVLPADYSVDIPRGRVDLVHSALAQELRNQKFLVVEDSVVQSLCSSPTCPERDNISKQLLVDGFVTLHLSSFSKNNFIAGYYNQLAGDITVTNSSGAELIKVSHTESDSGGVLLESGQVIQGIISQVKNSGDNVFESLAEKFAKSVVETLPRGQTTARTMKSEGAEVTLLSTQSEWRSPNSLSVCAKGTPHSFAFLQTAGVLSPLRESSPGEYCGLFSTIALSSQQQRNFIELRSAFGSSVRRDITLPVTPPCSLTNRLSYSPTGSFGRVSISCASVGKDTSVLNSGCTDAISQCSAEKLLVYASRSPSGAFSKVTEISSSSAALPPIAENEVAVVAVTKGGIYSQPSPIKR
jgi:hypothetical protein